MYVWLTRGELGTERNTCKSSTKDRTVNTQEFFPTIESVDLEKMLRVILSYRASGFCTFSLQIPFNLFLWDNFRTKRYTRVCTYSRVLYNVVNYSIGIRNALEYICVRVCNYNILARLMALRMFDGPPHFLPPYLLRNFMPLISVWSFQHPPQEERPSKSRRSLLRRAITSRDWLIIGPKDFFVLSFLSFYFLFFFFACGKISK